MTIPPKQKTKHRAERYIEGVQSGEIVASSFVRKAIERHVNDLKDGHLRNLKFDARHGLRALAFIETFCRHSQGEWGGTKVILEPWECAIIWILFSWRWADSGNQRFRVAYIEMAKGNGKSFLCSALCAYELIGLDEPGSEVFSVAVAKDQARLVFDEASFMVRQSPDLSARIKVGQHALTIPGTRAKMAPLSSDTKSLDGKKPQCLVADEIHRWGAGAQELWDLLINSLGKRRSPLFLVITTAAYGTDNLCKRKHDYSDKVLSGVIQDDTWFAWVCCLDKDDDYLDERNWIKSNPNLGVSVKIEELRTTLNQALGDPASLNGTLRLRLGVWTQSHEAWIPLDAYDECNEPFDTALLKGRKCFGGLDLSSTTDTTCFALVFPPSATDAKWRVLPHFFLPADNIEERVKRDRVPYDQWAKLDLFELTPDNVVDTQFILERVRVLSEMYQIVEVGFDRALSADLTPQLEALGLTMVPIAQTPVMMTPPCKRFMELLLRRDISFGANPVLRWQAGNVMVHVGPTGLMLPDKKVSNERIDGIAATLDAISRAMLAPIEVPKTITYRGLRSV